MTLANRAAIAQYSGMKYSGDEHDARHLAHLLRLKLLRFGHIFPPEWRAARDLARKRLQMVQTRTEHPRIGEFVCQADRQKH